MNGCVYLSLVYVFVLVCILNMCECMFDSIFYICVFVSKHF